MPGSLNGVTVKFRSADANLEYGAKVQASPFQEFHRHSWQGPQGEELNLPFHLEGATAWRDAKYLARLLRIHPVALANHDDGVYFDAPWAWLRPFNAHARFPSTQLAVVDLPCAYAGTPWTHDLGIVVLSRPRSNVFDEPHVTAAHIPGAYTPKGETVDDADRNVVQSPSHFADHDAGYAPNDYLQNGLTPIRVPLHADPGALFDDVVHALLSGAKAWGSGEDLAGASLVSKRVTVSLATANRVTVTSSTPGLATSTIELDLGSYTAAFARQGGLPITPNRGHILLDNDAEIILDDASNCWFIPSGSTFQVTSASPTVRALASGVFYHEVHDDVYLVSDSDFAVAADGTVSDYTSGARFGVAFTAATGTTRTTRLRELNADTLVSWVLVPKGRKL